MSQKSKRHARPQHIRTLITLVLLLLLLYGGLATVVATTLTIPVRIALSGNPQQTLGLRYEAVSFPARGEAIMLGGWFIPAPVEAPPGRVIIMVHGKDGCRTCGFNGQMLRLAGALQQRGFNILLMDLRGHGGSGDGRFTFGLRERHDIEGAVDWLLARGFAPGRIGLLGESMGASSSIGAAADEPAIGALVADSAYAELMPVLEQEFPRASRLPGFVLPGAMLAGQVIVGEDIARSRPIDEIGRIAPRPVLIIHAKGDELIPVAHAYLLAAAAGVEPWIIPGNGHVDTYPHEPRQYVERVATFFEAGLRQNGGS